jgi:hypothetical protein
MIIPNSIASESSVFEPTGFRIFKFNKGSLIGSVSICRSIVVLNLNILNPVGSKTELSLAIEFGIIINETASKNKIEIVSNFLFIK